MNENKQIKLTSNHQLFDIHGALKNFKTAFNIQGDGPFEFAIVNQTQLDNDDIVFTKVNTSISNVFQYNDNAFQNFFICLKSDNNATVNFAYQTEEVIPTMLPEEPMTHNMRMMENHEIYPHTGSTNNSFYRTVWFKVFVISIVIMIVIYLYNNYKKSTETNIFKLSDAVKETSASVTTPVVVATEPSIPAGVTSSTDQPVVNVKPNFRIFPDPRQTMTSSNPSLNYQEFASRLSKRLSGL